MAWINNQNFLQKEFTFKDFASALEFVNKVGLLAEKINHHPEIWFTWGKVKITLTTHDQAAVTAKDWELAKMIDQLVGEKL